jgi:aminoglycoside phosphotransferase (APT) family kinase protein
VDWLHLPRGPRLSGLYHDNYVVTHDGNRYVLRIPQAADPRQAQDVEPRMFEESAILAALPSPLPVPRLVHRSADPAFLVVDWCPGEPLIDHHPPGTAAPQVVPETLVAVFTQLYQVGLAQLGEPSMTVGFGGLLAWLDLIHQQATPAERQFLSAVGLPERPFVAEHHRIATRRRMRLCHGDLQRPNFLVRQGTCHLIDWELATWADPLWDVAAHLHRAGYPQDQEEEVVRALLATIPDWTASAAERADYAVFLRVERFRSLVLDALRHLRAGRTWNERRRRAVVADYRRKLAVAGLPMDAEQLWNLYADHWL